MSDTPRTDEQVDFNGGIIKLVGSRFPAGEGEVDAVTADFARQLERELVAETKRLNWLLGSLSDDEIQMKLALIAQTWGRGIQYGDYRAGIDQAMGSK